MNPIDKEQLNAETQSQSQGKDENRFTRLINNLDQNDKKLNPEKRKRKWVLVLAGLFLLYLISFLFPTPQLSHESLGTGSTTEPNSKEIMNDPEPLTFEMPVDSFENILKKQLHEKLPKEK